MTIKFRVKDEDKKNEREREREREEREKYRKRLMRDTKSRHMFSSYTHMFAFCLSSTEPTQFASVNAFNLK